MSQDKTWAALNDPQVPKACITRCESLQRSGDEGKFASVGGVEVAVERGFGQSFEITIGC